MSNGEIVYGVTYSDNDYEEYSFHEIMRLLQPYNPEDDIDDDEIIITPFFGSKNEHSAATDTLTITSGKDATKEPHTAAAKSTDKRQPKAHQKATRRSTRVRAVRRPHNVGTEDISSIPSSQNRRRLRKAMFSRTVLWEDIIALSAKIKPNNCKLCQPIIIPADAYADQLPLPKNYHDAITGPYREYWIKAIAEEMENLRHFKVWKIQKLPHDAIPVKGKLVFKWKADENNHVAKAKVRFTMQGCRQIKGLHFRKTYAPVAYAASIRLALKLGVDLDYVIDTTDIKAAYLSAYLEPDITLFIEPPPGVDVPTGYGLRLVKALYGSMQGAQRLDVHKHNVLESMGYRRLAAESSIYYTKSGSKWGFTMLVTVVDDFLILTKTRVIMRTIKGELSKHWTISDKGPVKWMLNTRIRRDRPAGILKIDQSAYIEKKLREFGLDHLPPKTLPMSTATKLTASMCPTTKEGKSEASKLPYRSRTGALNYLRITRPDLCCVNSILSQFNKEWGKPHFDATTYAWQHAGGTKNHGLIFRKSGWTLGEPVRITVWVDAGHASCPDTRRSRGGHLIFLNGDLVDFGCKLQSGAPAQSSAVAEYRAVTDACNAVIWLRSCLNEMGISVKEPILFREDNQACINMATNYMTTKRTKHVDIKHHVIRYWCRKGVMDFAYTHTSGQLADIMTKCLSKSTFTRLRSRCISDIHVNDVTGPFKL